MGKSLGAEKRSAVKLTHDVLCLLGYSLIITTYTASLLCVKNVDKLCVHPKSTERNKENTRVVGDTWYEENTTTRGSVPVPLSLSPVVYREGRVAGPWRAASLKSSL